MSTGTTAVSLPSKDSAPVGDAPELSVVIPVYNEEDSVQPLYDSIEAALADSGLNYEVILIDDGSTDDTFKRLSAIHELDSRYKVACLRRNFGQTAAMAAGFDLSRGKVVITMDADLQNDPKDIPQILDKMAEGYDIVSGWRKKRRDKLITRRLPSIAANWLISRVSGVPLHDYGCTLKAYSRGVIDNVSLYGELHRFIPALASSYGVRVAELPVNHHARRFGKSKYGLSRTIRVFLDLITVKFLLSYSTKPLQIFGLAGVVSAGLGFFLGIYLSYQRLFLGIGLSSRPLLLLAILLIFVGVQFISMGLLGEMIARTYHETQDKPIYALREYLS